MLSGDDEGLQAQGGLPQFIPQSSQLPLLLLTASLQPLNLSDDGVKCHGQIQRGAADCLGSSPPPDVPPFPSLSLSVEPPLSPSAGSPAVPAAASGGPRDKGTQGELPPGLSPPRAAVHSALWGQDKQRW